MEIKKHEQGDYYLSVKIRKYEKICPVAAGGDRFDAIEVKKAKADTMNAIIQWCCAALSMPRELREYPISERIKMHLQANGQRYSVWELHRMMKRH